MRPRAVVAVASFIVALALAGCVRITIAPSPAAVAPPAVAAAPLAVESAPPTVAAAPPAVESAPPPAAALEPPPVAAPPVTLAPLAVASTPPAVAPAPAPAPAPSPALKTVSKVPAPPKIVAAPPPVKAAAPPTLDLASLETRLRATGAIGVFTKLSLKNQVSDLFDQFKAFHHGGAPALTTLRQAYELLLLKVLSLIQDNDASLASAISASRESIWGILVDPAKFAKLG
jgi:hypothetical protein